MLLHLDSFRQFFYLTNVGQNLKKNVKMQVLKIGSAVPGRSKAFIESNTAMGGMFLVTLGNYFYLGNWE